MNEPHPFSILNVPSRDGYVQMSIESVGDFTNKLLKLNEGEKATLTRGYGILNTIVEKLIKKRNLYLLVEVLELYH